MTKRIASYALAAAGAALLAAAPAHAAPVDDGYDEHLYTLFLDCTALQILFAGSAEKQEDKDNYKKLAAAFLGAASEMSGKDSDAITSEMRPRVTGLQATIASDKAEDNAKARQLTRSCAYISRVGKDWTS